MYFVDAETVSYAGVHVMQIFRRRRALPCLILIASISIPLPASATPPTKERIPLTLSGSGCGGKEAEMNTVLQAIPGVTGVYFNRIPNHVLVDITSGTLKPADLVNRVNDAAT